VENLDTKKAVKAAEAEIKGLQKSAKGKVSQTAIALTCSPFQYRQQ
jgi:hypothetical protein